MKTFGGAIVSVIAVVVIVVLFVSELRLFLSVDTVDHLYVDVSRGEKLRINFDVTFPYIPCSLLSVDAMDVSGSHQLDVSAHIKKVPLGDDGSPVGEEQLHSMEAAVEQHEEGAGAAPRAARPAAAGVVPGGGGLNLTMADIQDPSYCGPCYGAESYSGQCCRTCDDVKEQYRVRGWAMPVLSGVEQCVASGQTVDPALADLANHRGCRMYGYLEVNKGGRAHRTLAEAASWLVLACSATSPLTLCCCRCSAAARCAVWCCVVWPVAGNFHFAPGKSFQHQHMHVHDLAAYQQQLFNVSHRIDSLSFGEPFPGQVNPLDAVSKPHPALDPQSRLPVSESGGMFLYYIKVSSSTPHTLRSDTHSPTHSLNSRHALSLTHLPQRALLLLLSCAGSDSTE